MLRSGREGERENVHSPTRLVRGARVVKVKHGTALRREALNNDGDGDPGQRKPPRPRRGPPSLSTRARLDSLTQQTRTHVHYCTDGVFLPYSLLCGGIHSLKRCCGRGFEASSGGPGGHCLVLDMKKRGGRLKKCLKICLKPGNWIHFISHLCGTRNIFKNGPLI